MRMHIAACLLFVCLILASISQVLAATDDWPMFRHDLEHTGYTTSTGPITDNVLWSYTTGGIIQSSPAVSGGYVYFGSEDHNVYCLNAQTGALVWNYTTGGIVDSSPAVSGGYVYFGSYDGNVYCLNALTGAKVWNYYIGTWVWGGSAIATSSPAVSGGCVYIGSVEDHNIYCLNAMTGAKVWNYTAGSRVYSSPAVSGGYVYFGSFGDGNVYCLNALTGAKVWNYTTGGWVYSSPAISGGCVYIGSEDGNIYCLNATTGANMWSYATYDKVGSSPAVANGYVYFGSYIGTIYCLSATTGAKVWKYYDNNVHFSSPAVSGGYLYIGSDNIGNLLPGNVYCLNALNGWEVWSYTTPRLVTSSPAISGGCVYIGSEDNNLYAFGASAPIIKQNATLSLQASAQSVAVGSSLTVSGTLTPANSGTVTIWESINGSAFTTLNAATLTGGAYSYTFNPSAVGSYQFYASWPGNAQYNPANSSTTSVSATAVQPTTPTLTLQSSSSSVTSGQQITLSGTITPSASGTVTLSQSVNSSAFQQIASPTLTSGAYSYQYTISAAGTYQFQASFAGNSQLNPAQSPTVTVSVTTNQLTTPTLTLQSSAANVNPGQMVILSGTITPSASGSVTIWESINGSAFTTLNAATLTGGAYSYTFNPAVGSYQFYASWPGNSQYNPANSTTTSVSVTAVQMTTPTLTLQSSAANVNPGQQVTLSGTITPSASGTVTLSQSVNGSAFQQIATPTLTSGAYSYQYTISAAGTYQFQASFAGNSQLNPAQSPTVTVSSVQATSTDYTWYIVGAVIIIIIIIIAAYYMMAMRPKTKPAK